MVAASDGACDREHRRRDYGVHLRPWGGGVDDLAEQRAAAPAGAGEGGQARRHRRRQAPTGDRQRGRLLPSASANQDPGSDGGADLGQGQRGWR